MWKVEGRCTQLTLSLLHTYIIIGWHKSTVSSDWSDTMVWFGQILLYLSFTILYIWSLIETVSQHENITLKTLDTSDMYFKCYESCYQPIDDYSIFVVEAGWSWFLFVLSFCQECATLELSFQRQEIRSLISRSQHFSTPPSWVSEEPGMKILSWKEETKVITLLHSLNA